MKLLLLWIALAITSCRRADPPAPTTAMSHAQPIPPNPANWMQDHLDLLGNRTLRDLTLPASHDSAMYQTGLKSSWARTQDLSIYNQLAEGIRYFDLRPQWEDNQIFLHHGPILGPKLDAVLSDVHRFMSEGHRELLLLKFSHYQNITTQSYQTMIGEIKSSLGPWLYESLPANHRLADVPLNDYVHTSGRILVLFDGQYPIENPSPGMWIYRDWDASHPEQGDLRVYDSYSNTMVYDSMKRDQLAKFKDYDGKCEKRPDVPCDLFLLSWTLTPPTDVPRFAQIANAHLADDLAKLAIPNRFGFRINLLYADCADRGLTDVAEQLSQNKMSKR